VYSQRLLRAGAPDCPVCTGQCPVRQISAAQTSRSRVFLRRLRLKFTGLSGVHRTVRWANGRPGQRSAARSARDTWPSQRSERYTGLSGVHRTCPVRQLCADLTQTATVGCAPSCLGAIKGTPWRMEEYTKHSYNSSKHQDINLTHSFHCDSI